MVLVWILISAYGSQIAMGVGEEKSNRIVEVILASVRPVQLLVGKVTGIGVLALAQAALMVAVFLGLGAAVGSSLVHGAAPGIVITGAVFLVLGYAFYCTAFAAAGSLVSRQSDVGTVILPVQIPLIVAYALSYTVIYANGANVFYRVLGFLPPTAPVAMPVLYAAGDVPAWQAAVSAVLRRGGNRVDGADRGDDLRAVHTAHGLPCPPASGARARAGLLSCLAASDVHVLAAEAEALPVAAGEDGEEDGDVLADGEEDGEDDGDVDGDVVGETTPVRP